MLLQAMKGRGKGASHRRKSCLKESNSFESSTVNRVGLAKFEGLVSARHGTAVKLEETCVCNQVRTKCWM